MTITDYNEKETDLTVEIETKDENVILKFFDPINMSISMDKHSALSLAINLIKHADFIDEGIH